MWFFVHTTNRYERTSIFQEKRNCVKMPSVYFTDVEKRSSNFDKDETL